MFTILDRYIIKNLLDYLSLGIVLFTLVLFFSDALLDFMKDLQHYGIPWDIAFALIGLQVPKIVGIVMPMSALLATLMVFSNLNNRFELIAMRMSGISLARITLPALVIGIVITIIAFMLQNYINPLCNKYARGLKTFAISQQNLPATQENFTYKQFNDNQQLQRLLYVSHFKKKELGYSTLIDLTNPITLQVTQARSGTWGQSKIHLNEANVYTVASNKKLLNTTRASMLELQNFIRPPDVQETSLRKEKSFFELRRWLQQNHHLDLGTTRDLHVTLWEKLTFPLSCLPMVMIAIPLAMTSPRRLVNIGFPGAIVVLFLYYLIRHFSVQLGHIGMLPPVIAAIMPLFIISAAAVLLFYRKNKVL